MKKYQRKTQKFKKRRGGAGIKSKKNVSHAKSKAATKYPDTVEINDENIRKLVKDYIHGRKNKLPLNLKGIPIGKWDVSNVTDMSDLFINEKNFNEDISEWKVHNVIDMSYMFYDAKKFNQDISEWNVSHVEYMSNMFCGAINFNQDISKWEVSHVSDMQSMFRDAKKFNQDISEWDVSNVVLFSHMFSGATDFEQDLNLWDVSNNNDMIAMFDNAPKMKIQYISRWEFPHDTNNHHSRIKYYDRLIFPVFNRYLTLTAEEKNILAEENTKLREPALHNRTFRKRKNFVKLLQQTDEEHKKGNQISSEPQINKFLENEDWNRELSEYIQISPKKSPL